jgi:hypothetical protein
MGIKACKTITPEERGKILEFISGLKGSTVENIHIKTVAEGLKGVAHMWDISKTEVSTYLSTFQSDGNLRTEELPSSVFDILQRISDLTGFKENIFLQIIDQSTGGEIKPHYDTAYPGYINVKANTPVISESYKLFVGEEVWDIEEGDLYTFEASLYKHWALPFNSRRVLLSFGFGVPYEKIGRTKDDPLIRMSERIYRYFQNGT